MLKNPPKGVKCYKVVSNFGSGEYYSAHASDIAAPSSSSKFRLRYTINETTVAPVGGLLVFKTFERALEFASVGVHDVFEGFAEYPVELPEKRFKIGALRTEFSEHIEDLWKTKKSDHDTSAWPSGTLAFKKFTPTTLMDPYCDPEF